MSNSFVKISLHIHPNAARNEVIGFAEGVWRIKVAAPPVKGKANQELVAFLSRILRLSHGSLTIVKGHTSRNKVVAIDNLSHEEVSKRLSG
jgi:uncharacterized protein (TIGR00251 family)